MLPRQFRPDFLTCVIYILVIAIGYMLFQRQVNKAAEMSVPAESNELPTSKFLTNQQVPGCIDEKNSVGHEDLLTLRQNGYSCGLTELSVDTLTDLQVIMTLNSVLDNIETICNRKIRAGNLNYGGWELCDDPDVRPGRHCQAHVLQNNSDFSFADGLVNIYGCTVKVFDLSFAGKLANHSEKIEAYNPALTGDKKKGNATKAKVIWNEDVMKKVKAKAGDDFGKVDIFMLDISGAEWSVLNDMAASGELNSITQLMVKFQVNDKQKMDEQRFRLKVLQRLEGLKFKRFSTWKTDKSSIYVPNYPSRRPMHYEVRYIQRDE